MSLDRLRVRLPAVLVARLTELQQEHNMELREQIEASALDAPARQTTEQLVAMVSVDSAKQQVIKAIVDSEPVGSWPYLVAKLCVAFGIDKNAILPVTTVDNQRMNEGSSR